MFLRSCAIVIAAASLAYAADPKPGKIVVHDPAKLAEQPDFAVQGEYDGDVSVNGETLHIGVQIIAKGKGKFVGNGYLGGLPGDGWDGTPAVMGSVERVDGQVVVKNPDDEPVGIVANGQIQLTGKITGTLKRVNRQSPTLGAKPPQGAIVLFGSPESITNWQGGKITETSDGKFLAVGTRTEKIFDKPFTLHLEFRTPYMPTSSGQGRGNSGVYIQDRYEIQVLDSFGLEGKDNECGGIYKEAAPKLNMCYPPMQWQTYDIDFTPAQFDKDGQKTKPAVLTVKHNGIVIHSQLKLKSNTPGGKISREVPAGGALFLQNHGDPVVFRNIWVVEK
ncbi:MAG: DUF1080 domain-containing protein [Bacteroidales bacterium]|nr:DUF1080 domain-containing protein [Bacteroidales bacterium]